MTRTVALPAPTDPIWAEDTDGTFGIGTLLINADATPEDPAGNRAVDTLVIGGGSIDDGRADLRGTSFNVVQEPLDKGDAFELRFTITNGGTSPSGAFDVDIRLSTNDLITTFDFDLGEVAVRGLAAGESATTSRTLVLPDASDPFWPDDDSLFAIGMRIDSNREVAEIDETNNSNESNLIDYDVLNIA